MGLRSPRFAVLLGAAVLWAAGAGCVHVAPYEREDLARPSMNALDEAGEEGFQAHVFDSREGATGGRGSTGGGCGCN